MDAGVPGVELQTHGHAAPEIRPVRLKPPENRSFRRKWPLKTLLAHPDGAPFLLWARIGVALTSSPTGC